MPRRLAPLLRRCAPLAVLLAASVPLAACERLPTRDAFGLSPDDSLAVAVEAPEGTDYRLVLRGFLPDTLGGRARFGTVVDGPTGDTMAVVRLDAGLDFGGGVFLCYPARRFPEAGTYPLGAYPDSLRGKRLPDGWFVVYRRGLLYNMASSEGTLTLTAVTDTLVAGSFTGTLEGTGAAQGGLVQRGTLAMDGDFRAEADGAGFILGL